MFKHQYLQIWSLHGHSEIKKPHKLLIYKALQGI